MFELFKDFWIDENEVITVTISSRRDLQVIFKNNTKLNWTVSSSTLETIRRNMKQLNERRAKELAYERACEEVDEKESTHRCCFCGDHADLKLEDGRYICDLCAQIQGELADE